MNQNVRATIEEALDIIRAGGMIILTDDEDRENEGDLVMASQFVTPEAINFMATHGRGLICVTLTGDRCDEMGLKQMATSNTCKFGTAFTVSVEAREGVTTGISAHDRARTIQVLINPTSTKDDIATPGHMFPLRARDGGVLVRAGQTEGSVDLARMAGVFPSGVICEIMDEDGTMARMPSLEKYAEKHGLKIITVAELIKYRLTSEDIVKEVSSATMPTAYGDFKITGFLNTADNQEAVALIKGDINPDEPVLVRVHSQCLAGDIFGSTLCNCSTKLQEALKKINDEGAGVLLYMYKDTDKSGFLSTPHGSLDPHGDNEPAIIDYGFGAMCLRKLGIKKLKFVASSPKVMKAISGYSLEIVED